VELTLVNSVTVSVAVEHSREPVLVVAPHYHHQQSLPSAASAVSPVDFYAELAIG
jgi:hypothetical protein